MDRQDEGPDFARELRAWHAAGQPGQYRDAYQQLAEAFPREDVPTYVTPLAVQETEKILADKYDGRKFDAIQEVITAVPTRMCESYYGIAIPQSETALFGKAILAISRYLFVPDTSDSDKALAEAQRQSS